MQQLTTYRLITPTTPGAYPVTLADALLTLRMTEGQGLDGEVQRLIGVAVEMCEQATGKRLAPQVWRVSLDAFPASCYAPNHPDAARLALGGIRLAGLSPVTAIQSVTYVDAAGATQTLDPSAYWLDDDANPAWLLPAHGTSWPATQASRLNAVRVHVACGYPAGACPEAARQWVLAQVHHWFNSPGASSDGRLQPAPWTDRLLDGLQY